MELSNNDYVGRALALLAEGLRPVVAETLKTRLPAGVSWTELVKKRDDVNGKSGKTYDETDLHVQLRALGESFGNLGRPFDTQLGRSGARYVAELREVRNNWAHNAGFNGEDAYRAVDTAQRLSALMGTTVTDALIDLRRELQATIASGNQQGSIVVEVPTSVATAPAPFPTPTATPTEPVAAPTSATAPTSVAAPTSTTASTSAPEPTKTPTPPSTLEPGTASTPDTTLATIEISAFPVVSYAMAHNRFPVVSRVVVHMEGPSIDGAQLTIGLDTVDGPLGEPKEYFVDLVEGEDTTVPQVEFLLDPKAMSGIEEARPGTVIATLLSDGIVVARATRDVRVLASNQWLAAPLDAGVELLAAFVQPNDPALAPLVDEASALLEQKTGSGSFIDGYADDADGTYIDDVVDAMMTAMRQRDIRYALPPASWADLGQKVRTASEVLDGRLGTCLDTAVVLAAALERVGVRPLLFVVTGHAYLGYWRRNGSLPQPAGTDSHVIGQVLNLIGLDAVQVVETTMLTVDGRSRSLEEIRQSARDTALKGDPADIMGVTDVKTARTAQIFPLPARSVGADGSVSFTTYSAPEVARQKYVPAAFDGAEQATKPAAPPRVEKWKNNLLDLSLRNRLINFPPSARFPLAVPEESLGEFEDYLNNGDRIELLASDHIGGFADLQGVRSGAELPVGVRQDLLEKHQVYSSVSTDTYLRRYRALAYKAKTIVEETGANNLYVAIGSLVWTIKDREIRSPLILVPVALKAKTKGGSYHLVLDEAGGSTPNFCLLEKLRLEFGLSIPGLADPKLDASGIDLDAALRATREAIAQAGINARVEPTVDIAILQFAKFRLWKDLDENWEALAGNALVKHLIEQPQEAFLDTAAVSPDETTPAATDQPDLDELLTQLPISADSSQLAAIAAATSGRTFVLEGPPGTGKSQTITNLLAKAIADGKRVLFVAEKKAALQVVQTRLAAVGLAPFTLDLHDRGSRPNEIRSHLKKALAAQTTIDEDGLLTTFNALDTARRSLNSYAQHLHEPNEAGQSFYAAHNSSLASAEAEYTMPVPLDWAGHASREELTRVRMLLRDVPDAAVRVRPIAQHAWAFVDVDAEQPLDETDLLARVAEFDAALQVITLTEELGAVLAESSTPAQLATLSRLAMQPSTPKAVLDAARTAEGKAAARALRADLDGLEAAFGDVLAVVTPSILFEDVAGIAQAATEATDSGFFGRKKKQQAVIAGFGGVTRPGVEIPVDDLVPLTQRFVAFQAAAVDLWQRANALEGVTTAPDWNPFVSEQRRAVQQTVDGIEWTAGVTDPSLATDDADRAFRSALETFVTSHRSVGGVDGTTAGSIDRFATALDRLLSAPGTTVNGWAAWRGERRLLDAWDQSRSGRDTSTVRGVSLSAWVAWRRTLAPLRATGLIEAYEALLTGALPADYATSAFERGYANAAEGERLATTGLRDFDPLRHNRQIERYTETARTLRALQVDVAPHRVVGRRTFDPKRGGGRVGELNKQLDRQRGGLSVRDLMIQYGDLISQATPCILVSPDSVARFFPAQAGLFDIVVFDEASQVRVADAVGAMGRANSVVVVGDSKQMPPTSFAEPATDDDDDDSSDSTDFLLQDEESILAEAVQARVERQFLSWHYRSQDESLIAFSNRYYYDEQLTSFPAPAHGQVDAGIDGHGISLVRVNGQFLRSGSTKELRTNRVEADAIVAEIRRRFDASPDVVPSVGVITFNAQQRTMIEALLRDTGDERIGDALDSPEEGLFVKNLENVQGDERDTILFSTAFSKNERGALPLNFGPLTNFGGERRLNVAITRARRQVIMFSSFDPQDLRADETTSRGIKDLRAYLELAQKGPQQTLRARSGPVVTDRHRDQIAARLTDAGLVVQTDVGLSDFKVDLVVATEDAPDEPVLAVLLDGIAWSQRHTVADRDALPIEVLEGLMHWPAVERVWLPEWLDDEAAVVDRLKTAARDARTRVDAEAAARPPDAAPVSPPSAPEAPTSAPAPDPVSTLYAEMAPSSAPSHAAAAPFSARPVQPSQPSMAREYEPVSARAVSASVERTDLPVSAPDAGSVTGSTFDPWPLRSVGTVAVLNNWRDRTNYRTIQVLIDEIVEHEGPIQTARLAKLVNAAFGLNKVGGPRVMTVLECIPGNLVRTADEKFIWPEDSDPDAWTDYRPAASGTSRTVDTISLREFANAMADLVARAAGMPEEELLRATLGVFGGVRLTPAIRGRLLDALRFALERDRLARGSGDLIVSPASRSVAPPAATETEPVTHSAGSWPVESSPLAHLAAPVEDPDFAFPVVPLLELPSVRLSTTYSGAFFTREQRFDMPRDRFAIIHEPRNAADPTSVAVYNGTRKVAYLDPMKAPFYSRCLDRLGRALEVDGELSADGEWFVHVPQKKALRDYLDGVEA